MHWVPQLTETAQLNSAQRIYRNTLANTLYPETGELTGE